MAQYQSRYTGAQIDEAVGKALSRIDGQNIYLEIPTAASLEDGFDLYLSDEQINILKASPDNGIVLTGDTYQIVFKLRRNAWIEGSAMQFAAVVSDDSSDGGILQIVTGLLVLENKQLSVSIMNPAAGALSTASAAATAASAADTKAGQALTAANNAATTANAALTTAQSAATSAARLPNVTTADNGKLLTVVDGRWTTGNLPLYDGTFTVE